MFYKTYNAFKDRLDYTKERNGSWTAEFNGPFHVRVHESNLDLCRHRALDELDNQLSAWIEGSLTKIESRKKTKK